MSELIRHMVLTDMLADNLYPSQEQIDNCKLTVQLVNAFEELLGLRFQCTTGLRTMKKHLQIYAQLQAEDRANGKPPRPTPLKSAHLDGNACDLICPTFAIHDLQGLFLLEEAKELAEEKGAYFEVFTYTPRHVHIQRIRPASGLTFFRPY